MNKCAASMGIVRAEWVHMYSPIMYSPMIIPAPAAAESFGDELSEEGGVRSELVNAWRVR